MEVSMFLRGFRRISWWAAVVIALVQGLFTWQATGSFGSTLVALAGSFIVLFILRGLTIWAIRAIRWVWHEAVDIGRMNVANYRQQRARIKQHRAEMNSRDQT